MTLVPKKMWPPEKKGFFEEEMGVKERMCFKNNTFFEEKMRLEKEWAGKKMCLW